MRFKLNRVLVLLTSSILGLNASGIEIVLTDNIKPFIDNSSSPKGVVVDRIKKSLKTISNMDYSIDYIGDSNLMMHPPLLANKKYDIGLRWSEPDCKSKENKKICNFVVSKPVFKTISRFYRRKNSLEKISKPKDIYGKKICRPKGWFGFDLEKQGFVDGENIKLITPDRPKECFSKLKNGQVDSVALTEYTANPIIKEMKLDRYIESIDALAIPIEFSLIADKTNPKAHIYIHKLNIGLAKLENQKEN
jgi:polar amino acid transport system substrate-binding protein